MISGVSASVARLWSGVQPRASRVVYILGPAQGSDQGRGAPFGPRIQMTARLNRMANALAVSVLMALATAPAHALMSEKKEIELGAAIHPAIVHQFGIYPDRELQRYVDGIGQKLAAVSTRSHLTWHFTVLDDDLVNAFATPGGYVYITRGILAHMNSEADLAAVLGHEVAHITERHSAKAMSKQSILDGLASLIGVAAGTTLAGDLTTMAGGVVLLGHGRDAEHEADARGAEYLAKAGYPVESMLDVIEILKAQERFEIDRAKFEGRKPRVYHNFLQTHPDNDKRYEDVIIKSKSLQSVENPTVNKVEFLRFLSGLAYGRKDPGNVIKKNRYYNTAVGVSVVFPEGWPIDSKESGASATSPDSNATLTLEVTEDQFGLEPRDFLQRKIGVIRLENGREINVDGRPGYTGLATIPTPYGTRKARVAVVFEPTRRTAYVFTGAGRYDENEIAADDQFLRSIYSVNRMTASQARRVSPQQIRVVKAKETTTIDSLAERSPLKNFKREQIRLINGLYPDGEPEPGQWVKTVR